MLIFFTGLIASISHVVTGPDHLAAVTPLAIDSRKKSWLIGFSWGIGHTIGMLLLGSIFLLFKDYLPIDAISAHSETIIGFLLIFIGIWALLRLRIKHSHGELPHTHFHTKPFLYPHIHKHKHHTNDSDKESKYAQKLDPEDSLNHDHQHSHQGKVNRNIYSAIGIGIIHGFAGFSHIIALLPSLALPTVGSTVLYLIAFASGTIISMVIFSFILGLVAFQSMVRNKKTFLKWFTIIGAFSAIAIGILWIINPI